MQVGPALPVHEYTDALGNRCQRLTAPCGALRLRVETVADVASEVAVDHDAARTPVAELPDAALQLVLPSRYCPSDKLAAVASAP